MIYLILALIFYTAAILIGASASRNANTNLVSAIVNAISALIPFAVVVPLIAKKNLSASKYGVWMAVLGGITIALFTMALNKSFTQNKVGVVTPIVFGGAIFLSAILSYFIFKEKLSGLEMGGLTLVGIGLVVLIYSRSLAE